MTAHVTTWLAILSCGLAAGACDAPTGAPAEDPRCAAWVEALTRFDARCKFAQYRALPADRACLMAGCTVPANQASTRSLLDCASAMDEAECSYRGPPTCYQASRQDSGSGLGEYCGDNAPDCSLELSCDATRCVTPQGLGGECFSSWGCRPDLACEQGICSQRRRLGDPCHRDVWPRSDCELDAVCDVDTNRCVFYQPKPNYTAACEPNPAAFL